MDGCYASGEREAGWGPSWKLASLARLQAKLSPHAMECMLVEDGQRWTRVVGAMPIVDEVDPPAPCRVQSYPGRTLYAVPVRYMLQVPFWGVASYVR